MVLEITEKKEYKQIIKENKYVFIDFYAQWCGPCKRIAPYIEDLSDLFDTVKFFKIDIEANSEMEELAISFKVESMPTFVLLENGKEITRIIGADKDKLKKMLKENV
jgi:thioredoxin 1